MNLSTLGISLNFRVMFVTLLFLLAFGYLSTQVLAKPPEGNTRPGWGFGDTNHIHTGPPGRSVNISQSNSATVNNSVSINANTGGNQGGNGGNTSSGSVTSEVNIINSVNQNILSL